MNSNGNLEEYEYTKIPNKGKIDEIENNEPKYGYGVRHIQVALLLLCLTVAVIARGHMGVTIVAMTSNVNSDVTNSTTDIRKENDTALLGDAFSRNGTDAMRENKSIHLTVITSLTEPRIFIWPKYVQEMVLNAFYLGYLIMMFPIGIICQRYGGKLPLQVNFLANGIVSIATPWLAEWGDWKAVCFCRILQGLTQAGTYPCVQYILAKWTPSCERTSLSSIVYTGVTVGTVVGYQLAGILGASSGGWPSAFYAVGVICLLCFILLTVFGVASPLDHKSITEEEKNFILKDGNKEKKLKTPWRAIVTSKPMWGIVTTQIGSVVGFVFLFIQVPSYIHHILRVNVKNSGFLSSLPHVASFFTSLGFGFMSDYLINHKIVSRKNTRRLCNSISQCGTAFFIILTSYTSNTTIAVTALVMAMAASMGIHAGWLVNNIDLAPNFSGAMTACGLTLSTTFILLTPVIVSQVVTDMTNILQWRIMFFIIAGIAVVTNAVFVFLISTDIQPWNNPDYTENKADKEDTDHE